MSNNFSRYRGDDWVFNLSFKDSGGAAQDITGWTIWMTLKSNPNETDANADAKKEAVLVDGVGGIAKITFEDTDTDILIGNYYYDIQYKDASGLIKTVTDGIIEVKRDITRLIT